METTTKLTLNELINQHLDCLDRLSLLQDNLSSVKDDMYYIVKSARNIELQTINALNRLEYLKKKYNEGD